MIPVADGIRYLTAVVGKFEGHGEEVRVVIRGDHWFLEGKSSRDGKDIGARAVCWRFPKSP